MERIIIELTVRNHPGVLTHIAGLFSRRAINIEDIVCHRIDDEKSAMSIVIAATGRAETVIKQLAAHYDVIALSHRIEGEVSVAV
jgi:acetolactate synthase-1/3 small subunit